MAKQTLHAKSQYGWRWLLVLTGVLAWVSIGCNPQSLSMLLMPFQGDDGVQPEYKMFIKDKEVTLAIVTNFVKPDIRPDMQGADTELAEQLSMAFRKRCEENKHKLKLIPMAQVRSNQLKQQLDGGDYSPVTLGAALKADYVLDLSVNSFSLYEKGNISKMFRGTTDISINLYSVVPKDGVHRVKSKEFQCSHPRNGVPIDAGSLSVTSYRNIFAATVANDIVKMFVAYSPDEKHQME
jgi:hypothetical protein